MPEEKDRQYASGEPKGKPDIDTEVQPPRNQGVPPKTANHESENNGDETAELAREIRGGEKYLIGIGIATLLINSVIAFIYWGQLGQMRIATEAEKQSVVDSEIVLINSQSQFDRTMRQMIYQSEAAQASANEAKRQAEIANDSLRKSQRPWVNAESFEAKTTVIPPFGRFNIYGLLTMKNTGPSVANEGMTTIVATTNDATVSNKKWNAACNLLDTQMRSEREAAKMGLVSNTHHGFVLAPNQEIHSMGFGMGADFRRNDISQGFYLLGCSKYTDQFKKVHTTTFCFMPDRAVYRDDGSVNDFKFEVCNGFQYAD